jgi:hypothetical protein
VAAAALNPAVVDAVKPAIVAGKAPVSARNKSIAFRTSFKFARSEDSLLRWLELENFGIAIAAKTAMMMMTMRSSTKVKPFLIFRSVTFCLAPFSISNFGIS